MDQVHLLVRTHAAQQEGARRVYERLGFVGGKSAVWVRDHRPDEGQTYMWARAGEMEEKARGGMREGVGEVAVWGEEGAKGEACARVQRDRW